jgi:transposase-like protein
MVVYCIADKRRIITEAAAHGASKRGIARRYQISPNQIRRWTKEFQNCTLEMLEERGRKKTLHSGPERIHGALYEEVHNYFLALRQEGVAVKLRMLTDKYRALRTEALKSGEVLESYKTMTDRVWRYLNSEHLVVRKGTHLY